MHRRDFLATSIAGSVAGGLALPTASATQGGTTAAPASTAATKSGFRHSVCKWCYGMPLDELCVNAKGMGIDSVELLVESEWPVVQKHGLQCAVAMGPTSIPQGFNRVENHDRMVKESERLLPLVKAAGIPSMIVFSGNRFDMSDEQGLANCVLGLQRVTPIAEANGVTIVMELLNSKVDHKDYMCDRTPWGVRLVQAVGSDRFKLLYDIYHMQIMEGDVIRTINENSAHIAHYHTGGNPGRHEIDATQELNYPAIARAIAATGYTGYLGQEFIPSRDPMTSLREAVLLCTV